MEKKLKLWQCPMPSCGYIYNPEKGCRKNKVEKDVAFEDLPEKYKCPLCGAGKKFFQECPD